VLALSLVFSKAADKLTAPGFRWAPSSLRGPVLSLSHDFWAGPNKLRERLEAELTSSGLFVNVPGIILRAEKELK
jgi:hypothetical protein